MLTAVAQDVIDPILDAFARFPGTGAERASRNEATFLIEVGDSDQGFRKNE
jgi:hypothetical protein